MMIQKVMNDEEKTLMMKKLEEEFEQLLANGEDVKNFLYIPCYMLTEKIRNHLDLILIVEAYNSISNPTFSIDDFIVYEDKYLTIRLQEIEKKQELLDRLINYFTESEEYEKCAELLQLKNKLK